jgi:hypothetical protein
MDQAIAACALGTGNELKYEKEAQDKDQWTQVIEQINSKIDLPVDGYSQGIERGYAK